MKRYRRRLLAIAVTSILLGSLLAIAVGIRWGLLWVDTSPLHQQRPERPQHPACVYQPPGVC